MDTSNNTCTIGKYTIHTDTDMHTHRDTDTDTQTHTHTHTIFSYICYIVIVLQIYEVVIFINYSHALATIWLHIKVFSHLVAEEANQSRRLISYQDTFVWRKTTFLWKDSKSTGFSPLGPLSCCLCCSYFGIGESIIASYKLG